MVELAERRLKDDFKHARALLSPESREHLGNRFPERKALLKGGVTLGDGDDEFLFKAWTRALEDGSRSCRESLPLLAARLRRADLFELVAELVAAAASSTLCALLVSKSGGECFKIGVALVTLAGAWSAIVARFLRRAPGGGETVFEHYKRLHELAGEALVTRIDLGRWHAAKRKLPKRGEELAKRASQIAQEIGTRLGLLGEARKDSKGGAGTHA